MEPLYIKFDSLNAIRQFMNALRFKLTIQGQISEAEVLAEAGRESDAKTCYTAKGWTTMDGVKIRNDIGTGSYVIFPPYEDLPHSSSPVLNLEPTNKKNKEMVDHPDHYQSKAGVEVIDVIDAFTEGLIGIEAFDTGNALKYMCRWKNKHGIQDLEKAKWYIEHLINTLKKESK